MSKDYRSFTKEEVLNMFFDKIHSNITSEKEKGKTSGRDYTAAILKAIDSEEVGDPYVEIVSVMNNEDIGRTFSMIWNWSEADRKKYITNLSPSHRLLIEKIEEKSKAFDQGTIKTADELAGNILGLIDNGFRDDLGNEYKFETTVIGIEEEKQIAIGRKENYYETDRMELTGSLESGYIEKYGKAQEKNPVTKKGISMKDVIKNAIEFFKSNECNIEPGILFASGKMHTKDDKGDGR